MAQPVPPTAGAAPSTGFTWQTVATYITALVGLATMVVLLMARRDMMSKGDQSKDAEHESEDDEAEEPAVTKEIPPEDMPANGVFTLETLKRFNGVDLPICMAVCGKVVNVSSSANIRAGEGYGKLWAGRDATYALATLSLNADEANRMDFKLEDFTAEQQKALAGWYKHFTTKYPIIGTLEEYNGWDFSIIAEMAKAETPFGAKATEDEPPAEESAREPVEATPDIPADAVVLSKNDRVRLQGLVSSPELNGATGTLLDFNPEKGRFVVRLDEDEKQMLFKPSNLSKIQS